MSEQQDFANHAKLVPAFHFFVIPVLLVNLVSSVGLLYGAARHGWGALSLFHAILNVILAVALIVLAFLARLFALGVQDRVIRLEERLRMQQLLPEGLQPRINEFTINQLVALRFASDAELPELAEKVLRDNLNSRKAIKQMIRNWRADNQRI
jgi:L-asparagine transporter-like permease